MPRQQHALRRFERMSRLRDYKVDKGLTDPRGWAVMDGEGRAIGQVKDLIVDTDRMTASYMDVELDTKLFDLADDPRVLVPMHRATRDGDHRRLIVPELSRSRVSALHAARAEHDARFWDEWWTEARPAVDHPRTDAGEHPVRRSDLPRGFEDVRPGEEMRIPIVNEELVVERRPVSHDERIVARGEDVPRVRRDER